MAVNPDDIVQVTARMSVGPDDIQNVYYVKSNSSVPVGDVQFDADVGTWLNGAYANVTGNQSQDYKYDDIAWRNITQNTPTRFTSWPTLTQGTEVSDLLPLQTAGLTLFPTTRAKSQVRKYIGGFVETVQEAGGELFAAVVADLLAYAVDIADGFFTGDGVAIPGAWDDEFGIFSPVVSAAAKAIMATQRRRVKGVGS